MVAAALRSRVSWVVVGPRTAIVLLALTWHRDLTPRLVALVAVVEQAKAESPASEAGVAAAVYRHHSPQAELTPQAPHVRFRGLNKRYGTRSRRDQRRTNTATLRAGTVKAPDLAV